MSNESGGASCQNCTCYATQLAWEEYHVWYQTAMSSLGVLANVLILATLLAARISHSCHVYVLVLTLADLGYCLSRLVLFHYMQMPQGFMGMWQCRVLYATYNLCRGLSNWIMVLLAADRLRVVVAPLRTHAKGRRIQCATAATCCVCVAMVIVNMPRLAYIVEYRDLVVSGKWLAPLCYMLKSGVAQALRGVELAITFHVPVLSNAAINVVLCFCLWRMRNRRRYLSQVATSKQSAKSTASAERQLTHILLATSLMHSFFSLPAACLEIVNLKEAFVRTNDYFLYLCINYSFGIFYGWYAFANLPVYLLYNSAFRGQFLRLLLPCCCRQQVDRPDTGNRSTRVSTAIQRLSETNI